MSTILKCDFKNETKTKTKQNKTCSSSIESVLTTPNLTLELSTIGLLKKHVLFLVVLRPPRKKTVFFLVDLR